MRAAAGLALGALALAACKSNDVTTDSTSNVSAACVGDTNALAALCPAGTALEAHGEVGSSGACTENPPGPDGGLAGICHVEGKCALTCKITLDCTCGAAQVSREQVTCLECSTCGNGVKEPGEECDQGEKNGTGNGCDKNCKAVAAACSPNGDLRCSPDLGAVQICADGVWQTSTKCTADEQCNLAAKTCVTVTGYCTTPGEQRCNGAYDREVCGADHRWSDVPCSAQAPRCSTLGGAVQCVADEDAAVSANFRMPRKQLVIGGLYGFAESQGHLVHLGPVKK